jgi:hypothetical protein
MTTRHTIQARDLQVGDTVRICGWNTIGRHNYWTILTTVELGERRVIAVDEAGDEHRYDRTDEVEVLL